MAGGSCLARQRWLLWASMPDFECIMLCFSYLGARRIHPMAMRAPFLQICPALGRWNFRGSKRFPGDWPRLCKQFVILLDCSLLALSCFSNFCLFLIDSWFVRCDLEDEVGIVSFIYDELFNWRNCSPMKKICYLQQILTDTWGPPKVFKKQKCSTQSLEVMPQKNLYAWNPNSATSAI